MLKQQGDVLIEAVDSIPQGAKLRKGRCVLAEGEATGHAHVVKASGGKHAGQPDGAKLYEVGDTGELFLELSKEATVTHEEHDSFTIAPGKYQIRKVQEYDHFEEEARAVQD